MKKLTRLAGATLAVAAFVALTSQGRLMLRRLSEAASVPGFAGFAQPRDAVACVEGQQAVDDGALGNLPLNGHKCAEEFRRLPALD